MCLFISRTHSNTTAHAAEMFKSSSIAAVKFPANPAGFNSGTAVPVLKNARSALLEARDYLKAAAQDGRKVLTDLE